VFSRHNFDPRKHSAVSLSINEKLLNRGGKADEVPLKSFMVGPNVPPPSLSLRRPSTGTTRSLPNGRVDPKPTFLSDSGKWVQEQMPGLIAESQSQPLTATSTLTATLPGGQGRPSRQLRPVTAVHSYHDISPVVSADHVADTDLDRSRVKESTLQRPFSAAPDLRASGHSSFGRGPKGMSLPNTSFLDTDRTPMHLRNPDARSNSIKDFWARQSGSEFNLQIKDLQRQEILGKNVSPGSANCRLVGSRWRYIQRPVDGDVIYTDYYGRCGSRLNDYYGRAYNTANLRQFNSNRIVSDNDYMKVQASMPGINTLRTRPGLTMDATILTGPAERLESLSTVDQAHNLRGLHRHREFVRMQPGGDVQAREAWVS